METDPPAPARFPIVDAGTGQPRLLDRVRLAVRARHYSLRTEEAYVAWIRRFILFHGKRHPAEMGEKEINGFLSDLAVQSRVSASTQNQALAALLFLYRHVLEKPLSAPENVLRAKRPHRLPVVLTRAEVRAVIGRMRGTPRLVATLLYGSGMRLLECLRLRVKDLEFGSNRIVARDAKGHRDRVVPFPLVARAELASCLSRGKRLHEKDLAKGFGSVFLPERSRESTPAPTGNGGWQWVFPADHRSRDPRTQVERRHHLHETVVQRAVKQAVRSVGISRAASCHTFRHSFATHLIQDGYDIRTVQELLGHKDVKTRMIYTHVLSRAGVGVRRPADALWRSIPTASLDATLLLSQPNSLRREIPPSHQLEAGAQYDEEPTGPDDDY